MDLALAILFSLFLIQIILPKAPGKRELLGFWLFLISVIIIFGFAGFYSWQQYFIWKNGEMGKFFLPPYQNFDYFIFYVRSRFFNPYLLSLFFGVLFLWAAKKMNRKYGERFFEPVEPYLLAISIFIVGHPLWVFYLLTLVSSFLIINILITNYYLLITHKETPRVSLYYLWLPSAIFIILISKWLTALPWWQTLKF